MREEIDLLELWDIFKKHLIKIIAFALISALLFFIGSKLFITPRYKASTSMIINKTEAQQNATAIQFNDLKVNQELVNTYSVILKTRGVADIVINNLKLNMSYEEFANKVSVTQKNNTEIFEFSVVDTIPERAMDIANETSEVFKNSIKEIMKVDNVQILDSAILPIKPISPNSTRNSLIGALLGFVLSSMFFVLKDMINDTIKTSQDFTDTFGIPVIGVIPDFKELSRGRK